MATNNDLLMDELHVSYFAPKLWLYVMIWLPRTTDNWTHFAQSLEIRGIESRLYFWTVHACHKAIHWTVLIYSACLPQGHSLDCTFVKYILVIRPFTGLYFCTVHICHNAIYWTVLWYITLVCSMAIHLTLNLVQYMFATRISTGLYFCTVHVCHKDIHWTVLLYITCLRIIRLT